MLKLLCGAIYSVLLMLVTIDSQNWCCSIKSCAFDLIHQSHVYIGLSIDRSLPIIYERTNLLKGNYIMNSAAIKVSLFLCACIFLSTGSVNALSSKQLAVTDDPFHYVNLNLTGVEKKIKVAEKPKPVEEAKAEPAAVPPAPVEYIVSPGDSLTKIAETHQTEWKRLFEKNTQVSDPNTLSIGDVLVIPTAEEQLAERPLPEATPIEAQAPRATSTGAASYSQPRGSSAGNTYAPGYCTWYAKSRRPDLPNRLGNASAWVSSAAAQGFATGSSPAVGAIGQQGNHVVYVESVNGDGTVTISEMNYSGLYAVSSRTVAASNFRYIY